MTDDAGTTDLAADLTSRSDDQLVELLTLRPDLASPPPAGTAVLAQRAQSSGSVNLVGEDLDLLAVAVLESLLHLSANPPQATSTDSASTGSASTTNKTSTNKAKKQPAVTTVGVQSIVDLLDGRAEKDDIVARVDLLRDRALIWGTDEALFTGPHAAAALPWTARHTIGPTAARSLAELRDEIAALDDRPRELLDTLAGGSPLGRSRDAAPDADPARPIPSLIAAGLLARVDDQTVELPPVVGRLLRDEPVSEPADLRAPVLTDISSARGAHTRFGPAAVEAASGGEALELIRHAGMILDALAARPAAVLRAGGLGVREQRRIAKDIGVDVNRVALLLEILGGDHLIDTGYPDPPPASDDGEIAWTPTTAFDAWAHQNPAVRWHGLAAAWLDLPRRPWQIGGKTREGTTIAALSGDLFDSSAPVERRMVLAELATAAVGTHVDTDTLVAALAWRHPRWARRLGRTTVAATLAEAQSVGLVAHGALTESGRALIGSDAEAVTAAMAAALPAPIDHFLTQADLTVTAPGPLIPELAEELALVAELESGGAASVYRVTENSVRRALDAGRSTSEILSLFTTHSRTPVPQSLEYLVADVGRRHGQLRVGVAGSFIRCEDPTMLAAVLSSPAAEDLALRALAPTVAISPASVREVLDRLRAAGFAPAGEDASGAVVDLSVRGSRVTPSRRTRTARPRRPPAPASDQLAAVVGRIRAHDAAEATATSGKGGVRATGSGPSVVALLQLALRAGRRVRVDYVDAHGGASRHVVAPRGLSAGSLTAQDVHSGETERFPIHRIREVELLE
ncbi:helicase-associated domain-containing protein [Gordonia jinhuaensis]|uniref:DNA-binding protein n=1 Tax=Gordonia jinhuaensis TaxID=1517702 RepID=A0A916TAC6_9ACTN|nr:helicase-associated domain-containing protein [Gordonia jinhuaensis]GGB37589.1 DNA-binding protein [Gordonia jinhuaensis]